MRLLPEGEQLIRELRKDQDTADDAWRAREPYRKRYKWLRDTMNEGRELFERVGKALPGRHLKAREARSLIEELAPPSKRKWRFNPLDLIVEDASWLEKRMKDRGLNLKGELTPELIAAEHYLRIKHGKGKGEAWEGREDDAWKVERQELAKNVRRRIKNPSGTTGAERHRKAKRDS